MAVYLNKTFISSTEMLIYSNKMSISVEEMASEGVVSGY